MGDKLLIITMICLMIVGAPLGISQDLQQSELPEEKGLEPAEEIEAEVNEKMALPKPGHVTVNFRDADIRTVLNYFSEVSGLDIVPAPNVTGTITLKLTDKPWEVALDVIVRNYGYAIEREQDIIRVITVDSLRKQELSTEVLVLNYATAEDIQESVKDMLSARGKATYDTRTNVLLVTDVPANIYRIRQIVSKLDKKTPQVMIEAKIIETILQKDEKMGIDWNIKIAAVGAKRPTTVPFNAMRPDWGFQSKVMPDYIPDGETGQDVTTIGVGGATQTTTPGPFPTDLMRGSQAFPFIDTGKMYDLFTYGTLDFSEFSAVLELLKQRRDTEIVSNPRITTLNNQEAKIVVGRVYNFPTFSQVEETGRWVISGYEPKELGVKLLVTPHVNEKGEISVDLRPEISNYLGLEKITEELSAPLWSTREAETQVIVKDGDTIFIGGLITENTIEIDKRIPFIGDLFGGIPFLGQLVKHKVSDKEKTELIFFITVHLVKDMESLTVLTGSPKAREVFISMKKEKEKAIESLEKKESKPWFDFRKKK